MLAGPPVPNRDESSMRSSFDSSARTSVGAIDSARVSSGASDAPLSAGRHAPKQGWSREEDETIISMVPRRMASNPRPIDGPSQAPPPLSHTPRAPSCCTGGDGGAAVGAHRAGAAGAHGRRRPEPLRPFTEEGRRCAPLCRHEPTNC
jgi:hypothetical protein